MTKKNIFDRLSLKKKISLNKQNKISNQLSSELEKNTQLIEQIKELQNDRLRMILGLDLGIYLNLKIGIHKNWQMNSVRNKLNK